VSWAWANRDFLLGLIGDHLVLALVPIVVGIAIALPAGVLCARFRWAYPPVLSATTILYAIPSLAFFMILIDYTGLTRTTVIIPLTLFSLSILIPAVVDGLRSVPEPVRQAATAMGFGPLRRLVTVELPVAIPVIIGGLRVATVSSISLVSVGQLIGIGGLGYLFIDGEQRFFMTEIVVGIVLSIVLALLADSVLVLLRRLLTPWLRGRSGTGRARDPGLRAAATGRAGERRLAGLQREKAGAGAGGGAAGAVSTEGAR